MGLLNILFISRTWQYSRQYDAIISNVTVANNISAYTKENIDTEMWNIVAGKKTFKEGQQYELIDEINTQVEQLIDNTNSQRGQLKLDVILRTVDTLKNQVDLMGQQVDQGMPAADNETLLEKIRETSTLIQSLLADYMLFEVERSGQQYDEIQSNYTNWIYINLIAMGLIVIFSAVAAWFISASIYVPIKKLHDDINTIVQRDLETPVINQEMDEISELEASFNILVTQLRQSFSTLEEQVQERTGELALSLEVGQRVTNIRDMNTLLSTVAEFIWDQFSLHYVQVFLVDDINQNLVLRAGTDQIGQELLAHNLSMPIDTETAVGRAVIERRSIIVSDTTAAGINTGGRNIPAAWYSVLIEKEKEKRPVSLLPESLSELAIPLIVEGQVLGVLDLQDNKIRSFTEKGLSVYEAIAVQLSVSVDSARQWELAQQAQQRAEQAVRQLTREGWTDRLVSSWGEEGFVYDLSNVRPLSAAMWTSDKSVSVPLVVQDQAIGQLNVNAADRHLTVDEQALLQAVAQQLAQKAENLRLFEATQQRASREQIARQIIDKVRSSRNIETALRTATEELNRVLGTATASIDLQITPSSPQGDSVGETEDVDTANNGESLIPTNGKQAEEIPVDLGEDLE